MNQPFNTAISMVSRNLGVIIGATLIWGIAPFVVGALALTIGLLSSAYLAIFHVRGAEMLQGRPLKFGDCFSFRGAARQFPTTAGLALRLPLQSD